MRHYLLLLLLILLPAAASAKSGPVVYVCAHPDDCFLFMSPNIYDDITKDADNAVIIYLTSGDAGLTFDKDGASTPYPIVREMASIDATGWAADVGQVPIQAQQKTEEVTIHGHIINRISYVHTVSYFLRLPDGNMDGNGFERYGYQSMQKLKSGDISALTPIDGHVPYAGWQDLVAVLSGILSRETTGEKNVTLHIAEPDVTKNYNDHSDHTTGASAMMEALTQEAGKCYRIYKHIDYSITEKTPNLEGIGLQNKSALFAVLTATQRHHLDSYTWDEAHLPYLTRNYYTTEIMPEGCGS